MVGRLLWGREWPPDRNLGGMVGDNFVWAVGTVAALAASGLAWVLRWLSNRGLEIIDTDVPDTVPLAWLEMHYR